MFDWIRQLASAVVGERDRQASVRKLNGLSDHMLADLGIRRDQLQLFGQPMPLKARANTSRKLRLEPMYLPDLECCG